MTAETQCPTCDQDLSYWGHAQHEASHEVTPQPCLRDDCACEDFRVHWPEHAAQEWVCHEGGCRRCDLEQEHEEGLAGA